MSKNIKSDYIFCHSTTSLKNIVMLAQHQTIVDALLKDAIEPYYFFMHEDTEKAFFLLNHLNNSIRNRSLVFSNTSSMEKLVQKKQDNIYKKIILISDPSRKLEMNMILRREIFLGAVLYNFADEREIKYDSESDQSSNEYSNLKIQVCKTKMQLKEFLTTNKWTLAEEKRFPNFVLLRQEVEKSTLLYRVMTAMINEKMNSQVRTQIIIELGKLIELLFKYHPKFSSKGDQEKLQEVLQQLKQKVSTKKIVRYYSSEGFKLYALLNIFLRGLSCPTQIYYIQPIVRDLFKAVEKLHSESKNNKFICYRGGFMEEEEFLRLGSAVGEIIQNLGFLSTSKDKEATNSFYKNFLFIIIIQTKSIQKEKISGGFADISKLSEFMGEEEVLFNPLNYFKVIETTENMISGKKIANSYFVMLRYTSSVEKQQQYDEQNQQVISMLFQLHKEMKQSFSSQSRIIFDNESNVQFSTVHTYFEFFKSKADSLGFTFNDSAEGFQYLFSGFKTEVREYLVIIYLMGRKLITHNQLKQGNQLIRRCQNLCKTLYGEADYMYYDTLMEMGVSSFLQENYESALKYFEICEKRARELHGEKNKSYLSALIELGRTLCFLQRKDDALLSLNKCYKIRIEVEGELHPNSLNALKNIAKVYNRFGDFEKAYEVFKKCECYENKILGEKHQNYFYTLFNLAETMNSLGRQEEMFELLKKCVHLHKFSFEGISQTYCVCLNQMVTYLNNRSRFREAMPVSLEAERNCLEQFGENHQLYLDALSNRVILLLNSGKSKEAQVTIKKMYQTVDSETWASKPRDLAEMLNNIGYLFSKVSKHSQSLKCLRRAEKIYKQVVGNKQHPVYRNILKNLANCYMNLGNFQESLRNLQICEILQKECFGENKIEYLTTLSNVSVVMLKMNKFEASLVNLRRCLKLLVEQLGENSPKSLKCLINIATALLELGRNDEALSILKGAEDIFLKSNEPSYIFQKYFLNLALKIGEFYEIAELLSKISLKSLLQQFSDAPTTLAVLLEFAEDVKPFHQFVEHKKKMILTESVVKKEKKSREIQFYERVESLLFAKKAKQKSKRKKSLSWVSLIS